MEYNLSSGASKTILNESEIYDPEANIDILYGSRDSSNAMFSFGGEDSSGAISYGGYEHSNGLHRVHLNRKLTDGERIRLHWFNGCDLIIFGENGKTKVKRVVGGTYQEAGLLDNNGNENTFLTFDDDISKTRYGYIETQNFQEF